MININEKEVAAALVDLQADTQPIHLELGVTEAYALNSTIQLASLHPTKSKTVTVACDVMKRHEEILTEGNLLLKEVVKAGWKNRPPNVPQKGAIAAMYRLKTSMQFEMSKFEGWCLIGSIQLAHRHKEYLDSQFAPIAGEAAAFHLEVPSRWVGGFVGRQLQDALAPSGILATVLEAGWDENMDIKV